MMQITREQIARVAHQANRAYCETIGDTSQSSWEFAPKWQRDSAINGVEFHVRALRAGKPADPRASHEFWLKEKLEAGWTNGPVKDPEKKQHPCCVPYDELPAGQRVKDFIFCAVVTAFFEFDAKERGLTKLA
jgi:RyR domain